MTYQSPYPEPVAGLLAIGEPRTTRVDPQIAGLGLSQEHVPDLVRMAADPTLNNAPGDRPEVWAPYHAMQALKGLDAAAFVDDLMPLVELEDDWFREELPELFGRIGQPALAPLRTYLADRSHDEWAHVLVERALGEIARQHPELRDEVVTILSDVLRAVEQYSEMACTFAMDVLVEIGAVEALPLIRRAFELDKIDTMVRGDWADILEQLGADTELGDPLLARSRQRAKERRERIFPSALRRQLNAILSDAPESALERLMRVQGLPAGSSLSLAAPEVAQQAETQAHKERQRRAEAQKEKQKHKAAASARKTNKKKRK